MSWALCEQGHTCARSYAAANQIENILNLQPTYTVTIKKVEASIAEEVVRIEARNGQSLIEFNLPKFSIAIIKSVLRPSHH